MRLSYQLLSCSKCTYSSSSCTLYMQLYMYAFVFSTTAHLHNLTSLQHFTILYNTIVSSFCFQYSLLYISYCIIYGLLVWSAFCCFDNAIGSPRTRIDLNVTSVQNDLSLPQEVTTKTRLHIIDTLEEL